MGWIPVTFYNPDYPKTGAKTFFSGGAGLSSTTGDYAKFLQMYLNGGIYNGKRILSPHTITTIMTNQVGDLLGEGGKDYGLAFGIVDQKGVQLGGIGSLGTFDWGGYFNTQYFADPKEKIIGLIFKQTSGAGNGDETGWKFRQMVFTWWNENGANSFFRPGKASLVVNWVGRNVLINERVSL